MIVELNLDWTYPTTPTSPYPVTIYWKRVGLTSYSTFNMNDASVGTATITTVLTYTDYITTDCNLEYEGYIIPNCFIGSLTDCDPDGPSCPSSNRVYWTATVDATEHQACRSISATCDEGGVIGLNIDPATLSAQTYTLEPTLNITGGDGVGFTATLTYDSGTQKVTGFTITNPGSGYTTLPTVEISPSDTPVTLELDVVVGCDTFEYTCCADGDSYVGFVNVGESVQFCVKPAETTLDPFVPGVANTIGDYSFIVEGCCTGGSGTTRYQLTFTSPNSTLYPFLDVYYSEPGGKACVEGIRLLNGISATVCAITGTLTAASASVTIPSSDLGDNNWLFSNYLTATVVASPC